MQFSKNIWQGGEFTDLNEVVRLANNRRSIILERNGFKQIKPAAFIQNWRIKEISQWKMYYAIPNSEITEVEFE